MKSLSTLALAGMELRRFLRGRLTAAALAVLAVVPLLYGALYLYAFWDPYGRLNHIPAALVIDDRPARAIDGSTLHAGRDLADELIRREIFDWHVTDERGAAKGLETGDYQLMLHIPADFSADLVTGPDQHANPQAAQLRAVSDDATNYLSGVFARTAFDEVRAAAARSASARYYDAMLIGFTDLKEQTGKAADGAGKLEDGADRAQSGAGRLSTGIDDAHDGSGKLIDGLGAAGDGADRMATGLERLTTGAQQIADGTRQAADGGKRLATAVDQATGRIEPVLRDNADTIRDAANLVARGAGTLAANIGGISTAADRAVANAEKLRDYLDAQPESTAKAKELARQQVAAARKVRATVNAVNLDGVRADLRRVAADARDVAAAAPHLADDVAAARSKVDSLAAGLDRLATGTRSLQSGAQRLQDGAIDLRGGIYRIATGARQLDNGLAQLSTGGHSLAEGLGDLQGGAQKLASGLADGAEQIPGFGDDPTDRAGVLADPVSLDRKVLHPAATYGVGFAPYFLALALWVGAMISFMVLKPLNRRYLMAEAPAPRVALAGLLPAVAVGVVQATVLYAVVTLSLGLSPVRPFATWAVMALTAAAFAAIMQLLGAALGAPGRILSLALLMLQLTSSGGTYPVQTSPGFFQAVHPFLPMTHVVEALRHAIDGGSAGTISYGGALLAAYGMGALLLTVVVAHRSRRLTPAKLHPELVL